MMEDKCMTIEEPGITEVSIAPDGRIFIFGVSLPILEICEKLDFSSPDLQQRLECLRK
jgi:hypothetical protein